MNKAKSRSNTDEFELLQVSPEFILGNQTMSKSHNDIKKSGGPYSKKNRFERRQEVYRLHFERSIPAVKIAELMKINRNTISSDIRFWYSRLTKDWVNYDIHGWFMRQINRLETQRSRLLDDLDKQKDFENKLSIERLVIEIDNKITQILVNTQNRDESIIVTAVRFLNNWAKDKKLDVRFIDRWGILHTSPKNHEKIQRIIKSETQ